MVGVVTGPQRVTIPTLQILAVLMSSPQRTDWYGRGLSARTGLGSGTVLECLYRLRRWGWLESRREDAGEASREGRPARNYYRMTDVGRRGAEALLAGRFKGQLRFAPTPVLPAQAPDATTSAGGSP
jgi:PadR family transcriptional regulator, regulatory protein PadR